MNCANHPETAAVAFCRSCGKPLCQICQRPAQGTIFCEDHAPAVDTAVPGATTAPPPPPPGAQAYSPYTSPYAANVPPGGDASVSPGLAFILGLIPGVGAIYNGQYAKGLVHVLVFGLLSSILSSGAARGFEALFGLLIAAWFPYMAFEAYHTAKKRQRGEPLDEFSSLVPLKNTGFPIAPIILILLGTLFLLNTLEVVEFYQIVRWWPVALIGLGVYMLYARIMAGRAQRSAAQEAVNE